MSRKHHSPPSSESRAQKSKDNIQITVAIIGLVGAIVAGIFASPWIEKWFDKISSPNISVSLPQSNAPSANEIKDQIGVEMALVPSGKFVMGSDVDDDEAPPHVVYLDGFYMDKYEVTNLFYKACVDVGICQLPKDVRHYEDEQYKNHPVVYVDWSMANAYCEWRGARLPTEAEWEKAARGTDKRTYPWGEVASCDQANYAYCIDDTTEVGKYKSSVSPYGMYDVAGNVWEWVFDWYLSDYYQILGDASLNPQGPLIGDQHVLRGGAWNNSTLGIRTSQRDMYNSFDDDIGFRCARSEASTLSSSTPVSEIALTKETQALSEKITDFRGSPMVLVPEGEFIMGTDNEDADSSEQPTHTIFLDSFYIDKYEVSNISYKACVDEDTCKFPKQIYSSTRSSYYGNSEYDNYPVVYVDWQMAKVYCEWRGAFLPTEAQWEKAARGTNGQTYPWGESVDRTFLNYNQLIGDTTAVGSYESGASLYGAYDMAGNVWEWVSDWYAAGYYKSLQVANPAGPELGEFRAIRGGSWFSPPKYIATFFRTGDPPDKANNNIGFRCALNANP